MLRIAGWKQILERGLDWLQTMCHPDGEISFFNDAAFGIAPALAELMGYAESIGCPQTQRPEYAMAGTPFGGNRLRSA
jgi:hypothetical protein